MISHIIRFTIIQMPPPILRWDSPRSGGSLC